VPQARFHGGTDLVQVPAGSASRLDALTRLNLAPGEYEIRVGVSGAERTGSVFSYVTIPAYAAAPLSISTIVDGAGAVVASETGTLTADQFGDRRTVDHYLSSPARNARAGRLFDQGGNEYGSAVAGRAMRFVEKE
jgi:hypothetical protein